ncbi:MAG: hypothetical protein ACE5JX_11750 [Acidobacteriota bacterium]
MVDVIWIGFATSSVGIAFLTLFGLIWPKEDSLLQTWGFRIGLTLLLSGAALTVLAS